MKLRKTLLLGLFLYSPEALMSQLFTPTVGYVRFSDGVARGVYGLEGNYILGDVVFRSVQAAAFSGRGALIAESGSLKLLNADLTVASFLNFSEPAPLVHLDGDLTTAIALFPASHRIAHWDGKSLQTLGISGFSSSGTVTSVRKIDHDSASVLVLTPDGVITRYVISLEDGTLKSIAVIPGIYGKAFEDGTRILTLTDHKLTVSAHSGETLKTFQMAAEDLTIEYASSDCLHLGSKTPKRHWLLHSTDNDLRLYELPRSQVEASEPLQPQTEISK